MLDADDGDEESDRELKEEPTDDGGEELSS